MTGSNVRRISSMIGYTFSPQHTSSLANAWDEWMTDTMQVRLVDDKHAALPVKDSACHTEISAALSGSVARPLLEKTFHMKIQSR